jgi:hypothetical protein
MYKFLLVILTITLLGNFISTPLSIAQTKSNSEQVGVPQIGSIGVSQTTDEIMRQDRSTAIQRMNRPPRLSVEHEIEREDLPQNPESPEVDRYPADTRIDKSQTQINSVFSSQTLGTTFLGSTLAEAGAFPPDVMGTVGPTQFIVAINGRIKSFNKTTGVADGVLNADMDVFFTSVMSTQSGTFTSDPRIRYDRLTGRWFVIIIDVPAGTGTVANRLLIAVSNTSTITGSTVWTYFYFVPNASQFADYPTLGIDKNALYIGFNMFSLAGAYSGTLGCVVRKSSILGAGPIVSTSVVLATSSGAGPYTPQGVDNFDSTATEGYFIGGDNVSYGLLQIRRVSTPGGTPSISSNLSVTVPTTDASLTVPHLGNTGGTNGNLDALDDRLFAAVIRNGRLWTAHNIGVNSSGTTTSPTRDGSRWYEIGNLTTTPTLIQSGTVYDNTSGVRNYWIPSVNISGQGHVAMGFTVAGTNERINAGTVGRYATDVSGAMQTPALYTSSTTAYNPTSDPGGTGGRRWGDYSFTSVDPNDDMTMWTIQEFCSSANNWGVQVVKLIAPPPATATSALPSTVNTNTSNINVTITGTSSSGSGFFDPGSAFPNRLIAAVNGGGVTVNSVTYTDATHLTLNISVVAGATAGSRTITITNPDGQSITSATGILTINNISCPTITLSPTTLPDAAAGSAYSQAVAASGGASPYTYAVTSGSLPGGTTLSSAGLLSGTPLFGGTFNFTITTTDINSCTGVQSYTLNVTGCPQITVAPSSLPNGTIGTSYSQTVSASGGMSSYSFNVTAGTLPAGLSLNGGSGVVSGLPTTSGISNFTITATDANTCTASRAYSVTINCPTIILSPTTLTSGTTNVAYNQTIISTGGTAPYTFSVTSGSLPAGITLSSGGILSGTTTIAGTSSITITSTDANSCTGTQAYSLTINAPSSSSTSLTVLGVAYSQDFNTLVLTGTDSIKKLPTGWTANETGSNANLTYAADSGGTNTGNTYSYGKTGSTDRALGTLLSGSLTSTIGASFINNTGSTITSLAIAYNGEEWRLGTVNRYDTLKFQYSLDATSLITGSWVAATPLNYLTTDVTGTAGWRNGNDQTKQTSINSTISGLNITNGSSFWIRWQDANPSGADDGLAVDDFLLTPNGSAPPTNPSVAGLANPSTVVAGNSTLLTATVIPGTNPTSTGIGLTGNLSSIGGLSSQLFYDDGTHGDVTVSDNIFSYQAAVSVGTTPGSKSLRVYVTDAQARTDSTNISLTVNAPSANPTVTGLANPSTVVAGNSTLLTANVTSGTNPTSTGIGVTGNLSSVGGSASQFFYDDGTHGDVTVSDNIFSYQAAVTIGTTPEVKSLPLNVSDAQTRSGSGSISLTVTPSQCPTINISPLTLPDDSIGHAYNQTLIASGGMAPYTFVLSTGVLPGGAVLSSSGVISGTLTAIGKYDFNVNATDLNGCNITQSYTINVFTSMQTVLVPYNDRWNLVSLPVRVQNDSVNAIFPTAVSKAFVFVPGSGYLERTTFQNKSGYWLRLPSVQSVLITGSPIHNDTIFVEAGWNLIGSISDSIAASSIVSIPYGILASGFYEYSNGYSMTDLIQPGKGYWVKVNQAGKLILKFP